MIGVGTFKTTDRMRELVAEVLDTNRLSYGPMSRKFESELSRIHGAGYGVLSNSGTSSLHVALQALKELYGWEDGDEVIVPSVTFVATVNVVLHNNLKPVLVDVDPFAYTINPDLIEREINNRTRAIIPVHLFGQPCDMTSIMSIAQMHGLKVIEDSCECMFAQHQGKMVGSFGDIGCFSTYVAHLITTGVGGMSVTQDPDLAAKMRSLVNHGRDGIYISIDDGRGLEGEQLREVISKRFSFESQGHSFRITELESALGLAQLETWESMIFVRQDIARQYTRALSQHGTYLQTPRIARGNTHSFMMYPIVMHDEPSGDITSFLEERGIETRAMLPLTNQPVYRSWVREEDFPVARWINENGFYIACHQDLGSDDIDQVILAFDDFFGVPSMTWGENEESSPDRKEAA